MSKKSANTDASNAARNVALKQLLEVMKDGHSLSSLTHLTDSLDARDAAFARMLSFGVLRFYYQLQALLKPLIAKPLKPKDLDVQLTMMMALYQLRFTRVPDYAVVDAAVKQIRKSRKQWAAKMVNGVLRNFIRQQETLQGQLDSDEARFAHPQWIIDRLKLDWPAIWQNILLANNAQAPMTLRINAQKTDIDTFQQALLKEAGLSADKIQGAASALALHEPCDVTRLPGFKDGWFSVQDAGAQLAAAYLQPLAGERILDACAAPGGKTAHLFEIQPDIRLTALDISESRLQRVQENCQRLGFSPEIVVADATATEQWWNGDLFDRILLDVPCSASGVIRRHPDIKHLRRSDDIEVLVALQRQILKKNWALLKPGGHLLYVTCSVFKAENEQQIEWFLNRQNDAQLIELPEAGLSRSSDVSSENSSVNLSNNTSNTNWPLATYGQQLFPVDNLNDGFYYALLSKKISEV